MQSVVFFNNKGGVGKTTLACNIASTIASKGKRVLLVDCDPQCNSTLLVLGEEFVLSNYAESNNTFTIKTVLKKIEDGDSEISIDGFTSNANGNRFNIDILPGHPALSAIEDILSDSWQKLKSGDIGGIRRTNWCYALNLLLKDKYDFIIYDVGPSLGALNRTILHGSTHFVSPMGVDIFSLIGIANIDEWMDKWASEYANGIMQQQNRRLNEFPIKIETSIHKSFIGYTLQQYITKRTKEGERRPTKAYEEIATEIDPKVNQHLGKYRVASKKTSLNLGSIPHLHSLIPLSQSANAPIHDLKSGDGISGSHVFQRDKYVVIIEKVATLIMNRLNKAEHHV